MWREISTAVATAALGALLTCASARAAELELAGFVGYTLPFYEQTFPIDLRPPGGIVQGIALRQVEPLRLNAKGGLAFAGARDGLLRTDRHRGPVRLGRREPDRRSSGLLAAALQPLSERQHDARPVADRGDTCRPSPRSPSTSSCASAACSACRAESAISPISSSRCASR